MAIEIKNIFKSFGAPPTEVLKGISLSIRDGEFLSINGRSGSGKSTLLYIVSTLDTPTTGEVFFDHKNILDMNSREIHRLRNLDIGFVFQFHYLLPDLTVLENVLLPAMKSGRHKNPEVIEYANHLVNRFGLDHRKDYLPSQISGGERQRGALARALLMKPKYIFADEPTGSLDTQNADNVIQTFQDINKTDKTTIMMVTHDVDYAAVASRQIQIADGRLLAS